VALQEGQRVSLSAPLANELDLCKMISRQKCEAHDICDEWEKAPDIKCTDTALKNHTPPPGFIMKPHATLGFSSAFFVGRLPGGDALGAQRGA
jgi:hypothetical protein